MDVVLVLVIAGCAVAGVFWGALRMLGAVVALLAALAAARWAGPPAAALVAPLVPLGEHARLIASVAVAVVAGVLVLLAARGLRKGIQALKLGCVDRAAGAVAAAAGSALVLAVLLALAVEGGFRPATPIALRLTEIGRSVLALQPGSLERDSSQGPATPAPPSFARRAA